LGLAEAEGMRRIHRLRGRIARGKQVVAAETIDAYRIRYAAL
jgi:RecG-like helicase